MEKTEEELELETLEVETRIVEPEEVKTKMTVEQLASRKQAHEIKVAKFIAGGKF